MAVTIGNARISEHGTVNGTRGDQTGKEVMEQNWASGGTWSYVFRPKNVTVAQKIATAMKQACSNNNIGYSQSDRLSLNNLASQNGYQLNKVGKCNCDCSSLVAVCCRAAGVMVSPSMYTGNESAVLRATGQFDVYNGTDYTRSDSRLRTGDILLRSGHTAIVTSGAVPFAPIAGKKSVSDIAREIIAGVCSDSRWSTWGKGQTRKDRLKAAGYDPSAVRSAVNQMMSGSAPTTAKKSNTEIAKEVIRGVCSDSRWSTWGSGATRKDRLTRAGYDYKAVQSEINRLMK